MSIKFWAWLAVTVLLSSNGLLAQTPVVSGDYAWRASDQPKPRNGDSSRSGHLIANPQTAHFRQDDPTLVDRQPSVSDRPVMIQSNPILAESDSAVQIQPKRLDSIPLSGTQAIPSSPQLPSDRIENQPRLSVADMGDPPPEKDPTPSWCQLGCERKLLGSTPNGFAIGGWSQFGYHTDDTLGFNDRRDQWNLHQQWFYAEKRPRGNQGWGYRADMVYGIDGQNIQAFGNAPTGAPTGWDNGWDHGSYGWALPQAYVSYENCNWDVAIGKFFSPFGFESIASPQNFFYSRSYARNFIEPFTLTGILGERRISDQRSVLIGATSGWDTGFDQTDSGFNVILGQRSRWGDNVSLASTASFGNTGYRGRGWLNSQVLQVQMSKKTQYVLQGDMLNLGDNQEFSIVNYLFHEFNPCLKAGTRLEWWKSDQIFPDTRSTWSLTNGLNFRPNANVTIRPETRLDWGAAALDPGKLIYGIDAIITF